MPKGLQHKGIVRRNKIIADTIKKAEEGFETAIIEKL